MRILRVFPRRTSYTPDPGPLVHVGPPDLWSGISVKGVDEVHVSCVFTWDRRRCENLAEDWRSVAGRIPVKVGGPGVGTVPGPFEPGVYVKRGITFTSRGCPNRCPWCLVPKIEGDLRQLPIRPGHIIQDNNLLATSDRHFAAVCQMLSEQPVRANFKGGFEAARLTRWHVEQLRALRIEEVWLASDGPTVTPEFCRAVDMLRDFLPLRKLRAYVMVGYDRSETVSQAERRLELVLFRGALPFAQPYRPPEGVAHWVLDSGRDMRLLARKWSRPAAIFHHHPKADTGRRSITGGGP